MNSFISWVGGKKALRERITSKFPDHKNLNKYVEVFGGAGWVLFYKEKHAKCEIYNDINSNLVNLFKCVKYHPYAIEKELELALNSRELFNHYKNLMIIEGLTDIQRAVMFLYIIKTSFGSDTATYGGKNRLISSVDFLKNVRYWRIYL